MAGGGEEEEEEPVYLAFTFASVQEEEAKEDVAAIETQEEEKKVKASSWAVSKAWFKDVFGQAEDDPDKEERVASKIVANWASLRKKGTTIVADAEVLAGAADLGVEIDVAAEELAVAPEEEEEQQEGGGGVEVPAAAEVTGDAPTDAPAQELQSV